MAYPFYPPPRPPTTQLFYELIVFIVFLNHPEPKILQYSVCIHKKIQALKITIIV